MGFKCSLLGHSFDETDVEREREERGSEVVTKVREVERCSRCGKTRTVSENKEVTSVIEPEDTDIEADVETDFDGDSPVQLEEEPNPEEEDAEILEGSQTEERSPGQWPDDDEPWEPESLGGEAAEASESEPDVEAEPDGEPPTGTGGGSTGGEIIEAGESSATESSATESSATEERPDGDSPANEGAATAEPAKPGGVTVPDGTYVCPECGFTADAENTSLREGDACPECQQDYLTTERNS